MDAESVIASLTAWRDHRDEEAARHIVSAFSPLLNAIALCRLPFFIMAEEAVQVTWIKFFSSLDSFDFRIPLVAWLTTILKRVCWNMRRSFYRHDGLAHDELHLHADELMSHTPPPDKHCIMRERLAEVLVAMEHLNENDRHIAHELMLDDQEATEIAQRLGISTGAMRVRAHRIRKALRSIAV